MCAIQNMFNRSIFLKYYFESNLIYKDVIIDKQLYIMVSYIDIIGLGQSVAILW